MLRGRGFRRQLVALSAGGADDPTGQNFVLPVGGFENIVHVEVRVAGENVDALVRGVVRVPQCCIGFASAFVAERGLAHAVHAAEAAGQRFVHSDDDGADLWRCFIAREHGVEPFHLIGIELIGGGVVERNEIDIALHPVIVGAQLVIPRIVFQALRAERGRLQPIGELQQPGFARHRRDGLMVAHEQVDGQVTEGNHLARDEIGPCVL